MQRKIAVISVRRPTLAVQLAWAFAATLLSVSCIPKRANTAPQGGRSAEVPPSIVASTTAPVGSGLATNGAAAQAPAKTTPAKPPAPSKVYDEPPASHREALLRQLDAKIQRRPDKQKSMDLPLADSKYWKRVHFTGIDHFTGFIYGEDRDLVTSAFVVKLEPGEKPTSQLCMERFESYSLSKFERHKGRYTPIVASTTRWRKRNIVVHKSDGRLSFFFSRYEFSAAWAAYPAYEDGCVVYATVVFWEDEKELAQRVRDHWADTAFGSLRTRGKKAPELPP